MFSVKISAVWLCLSALIALAATYASANTNIWPPPPPYTEKAKMARYLANSADWLVVSTVSKEFGFVPFGTVESFADGALGNGTGVPYLYLASLSTTFKNLAYNNTASITISQAESEYCKAQQWDPMLPLCARLTLSGKIIPCVGKEEDIGRMYLFTRHPSMKTWPTSHGWKVHKLQITHIFLQDFFGSADIISVKDYFSVKPGLSRFDKKWWL